MSASRIKMPGATFDCTASPYPWPHGLRVKIDIATSGKRIGSVHVLCALDSPEFNTLALLSPPELCDLALSRFISGQLPVALETVLRWQEAIASMGYDYISPLGSTFSCADARLPGRGDGGARHRA
jgi:hypothetical protein